MITYQLERLLKFVVPGGAESHHGRQSRLDVLDDCPVNPGRVPQSRNRRKLLLDLLLHHLRVQK